MTACAVKPDLKAWRLRWSSVRRCRDVKVKRFNRGAGAAGELLE
jgi:hypothetical protein